MKQVMLYGFACVDASLYLDTHPDDAEALAYFKEHDRIYREAVEEYSRNYGPLTLSHAHQLLELGEPAVALAVGRRE